MKSFLVKWYASGYCGTFRYMVVANNLEEAQAMWKEFVKQNEDIEYSWKKAESGVKNHYGGYITWEDYGSVADDVEIGCYEMDFDRWNMASAHLND